jgi:hypothetical protein
MTGFSPKIVENEADLLLSGRSTVFLLGLRPLGEPLLQNGVFMHSQLERWTQANMRFDFGLGFMLEPRQVFCSEFCDKQVKPEFLLALFEFLKGGKFFLKLLIPHFLRANSTTLKTFRGINVSHTQLSEEKSMRILDWSSTTFLSSGDACIGYIQEILEFL